jgi:hypothetical protein
MEYTTRLAAGQPRLQLRLCRPDEEQGAAAGPPDGDAPPGDLPALLGLPAPRGRCRCGPSLRLRHRADPTLHQVAGLSCRSWGCPACGPRLRWAYGLHYGRMLLVAAGPLYLTHLAPAAWAARKRSLQRTGARWVRVAPAAGDATVLATRPLAGGEPIEPGEAVRALGTALAALEPPAGRERFRPVSSCACWALRRRSTRPVWEYLGSSTAHDPEEVRAELCKRGLDPAVRRLCGSLGLQWAVSYVLPKG